MNYYKGNLSRKEGGQASLVFIASLVIIIASLALLVDGGRYLVMRNRARMMADASALAGAGVLNIDEAQVGNFVLNTAGGITAYSKAEEIFNDNKGESPPWAVFDLYAVRIQGNDIWVTVTGSSSPLFGSQWGLNYTTTVVSSARAASGLSSER